MINRLRRIPKWGWVLIGGLFLYANMTSPENNKASVQASAPKPAPKPKPVPKSAPVVVPESEADPQRREYRIGERVVVVNPGGGRVVAARDAASFNEMKTAIRANDEHGFAELIVTGRVVVCSRKTPAIYLKFDWDARVVRLTAGEHEGTKVWVMPEHLSRS